MNYYPSLIKMNYYARGRITYGKNSCTFLNVLFEEHYTALILCRDFPEFYMTVNFQNINNVVIKSSMKSIDYHFIDDDTIRVDSVDNLSFWMEIDIQTMIDEYYK